MNDQQRVINDLPFGAWVVKADPDVWDITSYIEDGHVDVDDWTVQDNYRSHLMQPGDQVFLWVSGPGRRITSGFWGAGTVGDPPIDWGPAGGDYWLDEDAAARMELFAQVSIALLDAPITRDEAKADPRLAEVEVLRAPMVGNPSFLTPGQAEALLESFDVIPVPPEPEPKVIVVGEGGAGFGSAEKNQLVEAKSTAVVERHFESRGYETTDVSKLKVGWDLTARKGMEELHVEIKGVSGFTPKILLTRNEYDTAQDDSLWTLIVVTEALTDPKLHRYTQTEVVDASASFVYQADLGPNLIV